MKVFLTTYGYSFSACALTLTTKPRAPDPAYSCTLPPRPSDFQAFAATTLESTDAIYGQIVSAYPCGMLAVLTLRASCRSPYLPSSLCTETS